MQNDGNTLLMFFKCREHCDPDPQSLSKLLPAPTLTLTRMREHSRPTYLPQCHRCFMEKININLKINSYYIVPRAPRAEFRNL